MPHPIAVTALLLSLGVPGLSAQAVAPSQNLLRATAGVPVFLPVSPGGNLLVSTPPEGGKPMVAFFLRREMADSYVAGIRAARAEFANLLKVEVSPLADLLRAQPPSRNYELSFVADPAEVDNAVRELTAQGKPSNLAGVPVFLLRSPTAGFVTITVGGRSVIPAFLGYAEVAALREQLRRTAEANVAAGTTVVDVTTLESLLAALQSSREAIYQSILVQPSAAALREARS